MANWLEVVLHIDIIMKYVFMCVFREKKNRERREGKREKERAIKNIVIFYFLNLLWLQIITPCITKKIPTVSILKYFNAINAGSLREYHAFSGFSSPICVRSAPEDGTSNGEHFSLGPKRPQILSFYH